MRKETFKCNLCREEKDKKEFTCLYWGYPQDNFKNGQCWIPTTDLSKSDVHICSSCIEVVKSISI